RRDSTSPQEMQLRSQVEQLQNELATVQARAPQTPLASPPRQPVTPTPIVLIFTNGQRVETTGYAIRDGSLWYLAAAGYGKVDVSTLDIVQTQTENRRRGLDFPTPRAGR